MPFTLTPRQLETIIECETARMPNAAIAARLGVDYETFMAWQLRLAPVRDAEAMQLERAREATQARLREMMRGGR